MEPELLQKKHPFKMVVSIIMMLSISYAVVIYAHSFAGAQYAARTFSATGEAKVVAIPDVAEFTFSVITQGGTDLTALQKETNEKASKAIDFVKSQGVEAKDIRTSGYSIEPQQNYGECVKNECPPPKTIGYTVRQSVEVKARKLDKVGGILSGVVAAGANETSGLSFVVDDLNAVKNKARAQAIIDAQTKAEQIAKEAGFTVGRIMNISDGQIVPMYGLGNNQASKSIAGDMAPTPTAAPAPTIEPGSQEITVNVTVNYEIK